MPRAVEFHTGVPDTLAYACRLLRKAYRRGMRVTCVAPPGRLEALDQALWTFAERDFVPHAVLGRASARVLGRSPILLAAAPPPAEAAPHDVIVSLGGGAGVDAAGAAGEAVAVRLIEIVGADAAEAERGRASWRQYKAAGFDVVHHPFRDAAARED